MPNIPPRNPIGNTFSGVLARHPEGDFLALAPLPDAETLASGSLTVRYAITYLGKPHLSIVPGLVAVDYGEFLTGEDMWQFILSRSNVYPRADVIGYRNDGTDDMIVVKKLDLAYPKQVLIYDKAEATKPLATVKAIFASPDADIAPRILEYLPRYATLDDWKTDERTG